jgi:hypothetical protein
MSKRENVRIPGLLLLLIGLSVAVQAQRSRWEYLGEANVDGAVDHDNIAVTGARGEFRAIQIRVEKGPIEFDRVVVHYGNGVSEPIPVHAVIPAGGQTRAIDLPGRRRVIESVEFWYARANLRSRRPRVRLWGMR